MAVSYEKGCEGATKSNNEWIGISDENAKQIFSLSNVKC